jgi:hypothetical protein
MCKRTTKKFVCSRCSNNIFVDGPQITLCEQFESGEPCGPLEQIDIVKCEPALCSRCPYFPADSLLPFSGTPDNPLMPDVERRCVSHIVGEKKVPMVRIAAIEKARKTYLAGTVSGQSK